MLFGQEHVTRYVEPIQRDEFQPKANREIPVVILELRC
jgi:hypothetical protein